VWDYANPIDASNFFLQDHHDGFPAARDCANPIDASRKTSLKGLVFVLCLIFTNLGSPRRGTTQTPTTPLLFFYKIITMGFPLRGTAQTSSTPLHRRACKGSFSFCARILTTWVSRCAGLPKPQRRLYINELAKARFRFVPEF